jgi:hypothetical protein
LGKIIFLSILSVVFIKQINNNPQPSEIMVKNVYGEIVTWKQFPIVFTFHSNFPQDKQEMVKIEIQKFNLIAGAEVFKISPQVLNHLQPLKNEKDGINTLYWDFNQAFNMNVSEQGKASVFWVGSEIKEADINLQSSLLTYVDFPTLIRHELLHTLGLNHSHYELMSPHLPAGTVREWDKTLISQWIYEASTYAKVKLPISGFDTLASQ